jgi:hypothetical protein
MTLRHNKLGSVFQPGVENVCLQRYTLFHTLVLWITISYWPCVLVCIPLYSPHGSPWNVPEYSFGRIPWNLPWHTQQQDASSCGMTFKTRLDERDDVNNVHLNINWCCWLLCQCALAR